MKRILLCLLFASSAFASTATIFSDSQANSSAQGSGFVNFNSYNATSITISVQASAYGASQQGGGRGYRGHAEAVIGSLKDERTEDPGSDPMSIGASLSITVTKQSDGWYYGGSNLGGGVGVSASAFVDGENVAGGGTAWATISWVEAPSNSAPTISWTSTPGTVANGASYTVSAHGHDANGNLTQVNVWKNGVGFAFAGGGDGTDGDSGNTASDTGPATISFTAQAVDAAGATSATISQTVTVSAPANAPPTIAWTSTPGTVANGASYTVSAHGHDANGNLTQVNVWKNGTGFAFAGGGDGTDGDSGNTTSDSGPATISFTAQAVDAAGATSATISQTVTISAPANVAPTIAWTSTPGTVANGASYTVTAHGHDANGNLTQVNVWRNGTGFAFAGGGDGTDGDSGNTTSDTGPTTITFTAQAVDASGATSATISQTVTVSGPANSAPTIAWTSSPGTVASGASYTVSAHGHDADGNLSQVNVWKSGAGFAFAGGGNGTDGDSGNSTSDTGPATISFTAQAVDASGATSATITQTVTVSAPPVNNAPTIAWTSSPGTVSSGASYTVSAHGHDADGNLTQVNVWKNGVGFAFAGGGNGTDGDSGNATTDAGPATITFTAQAVDAGGASSSVISQTVTVNAPPAVTASISVSPTSAGSPGSTTVAWSSANASSVLVSGSGLNSTAATGSQIVSGLAAGTYDYTISAQGNGGPITQTATFTVNAAATVGASISASPAAISEPGSTTITWSSANATSVSVSGSGLSSTLPSGSQSVGGLTAGNYAYTITAQGSGGPATQTATVTVSAVVPSVSGSIAASPSSGIAPGSSTLTWTTANATSVSVSGPGVSSVAASGTQTVAGLAPGTYTYTLLAQGNGGPVTSSAVVTVAPATVVDGSIGATPATTTEPGATAINWTTTNATSVSVGGQGVSSSAASGSATVTGLTAGTYTYTLTAQGNGGPITRAVSVIVNASPSVAGSINVSPPSMTWGGTATLTWTTANASNVKVSGYGISGSPFENMSSLTINVGGLSPGDSTWTLWADGPGGPITRTATINVTTTDGLYGSLTTSPAIIYSNQSATLNWTTTGTSFRWVHGYTPGLNGVNLYPVAASGSSTLSGLPPGDYRFTIEYGPGSSTTRMSFADLTVLGANQDVTASVAPAGAGLVTGAGNYAQGATVTLTPVADATHVFTGWSGDFSGATNPLTFTVGVRDYSVTANFAPKLTPVVIKYRPAARTVLQTDAIAGSPALVTERP